MGEMTDTNGKVGQGRSKVKRPMAFSILFFSVSLLFPSSLKNQILAGKLKNNDNCWKF